MNLQERISTLCELGEYLKQDPPAWQQAKEQAFLKNPWFIPEFINLSVHNILEAFLNRSKLEDWAAAYKIPANNPHQATVGITMAGNIPLVGFHDFITMFMAGHIQVIKPSSKDDILIRLIADFLATEDPRVGRYIRFEERLNGCDAYIATGSNNSGRYFEFYFGKYPHIIRRNRTSTAILTGNETPEQLTALAEDMMLYFGLGCRNVSKLYVPEGYDFKSLLRALDSYDWMKQHDKFRNNYDYQLSLLILNNRFFMTNEVVLLVESTELFSPIAQVHYEYYKTLPVDLMERYPDQLQCICGTAHLPYGRSQKPSLTDYADGIDTMTFALSLKN